MGNTLRYALSCMLSLAVLDAVVSSSSSTDRVGKLAAGVSAVTAYLLSPAYPLIPDRRTASSSTTNPSAPSAPPLVPTGPPSGGTGTLPLPPGGLGIGNPSAPDPTAPPTTTGVISV